MIEDKRREIVEGVWAVIAAEGLAAVSFRSVASAAGVSPGRVQHYFASKSDLVRASVEAMLGDAERAYPEASGDVADPATLRALLGHSATAADASRRGMSVFFAYVAASTSDPWIAEILASAKRGQIDAVADCLGHADAHLADTRAAAAQLVALADGATQAVYLGYLTYAEAMQAIDRAIAVHLGVSGRTLIVAADHHDSRSGCD